MNNWIHPAALFILGAFLIPFLKGEIKKAYLLIIPFFALIDVLYMSEGTYWVYNFLGNDLILGKVDKLSLVFGYVFTIMAFIGMIYALHVDDDLHHIAAYLYIGSSLGVLFAGDYFTLFVFWEIMAFASAYLVFAQRGKAAVNAGFRYLLVHIAGGICLLAGIIIHYVDSGSMLFGPIGGDDRAFYLILIGFLLNAAIPPLSAWLPDAYPEATVAGAVFLSAFTTKTAVYVLVRAFPGTEVLIWLGTIMTLYGVFYAFIENDIRRILAYHIISQVGFMVTGVGLGTEMGLNGSISHAFAHILYKGLLFMAAGAIIQMTGRRKLSELGGLYKTMPVTLILYMIGGFSISAFPLFSGFISKSMVLSAASYGHRPIVTLLLTTASAGTFLSLGLKIPYFAFFGRDSGIRAQEPPVNMRIAMWIAAILCIVIGIFPGTLYSVLPYPVNFEPYTGEHVTGSLGLLLFTALGFFVFLRKINPEATVSLDTDWLYRKGAKAFLWFLYNPMSAFGNHIGTLFFDSIPGSLAWFSKNPLAVFKISMDKFLMQFSNPGRKREIENLIETEKAMYPGDIIKHWPIGSTVLWVTIFFIFYLLLYYFK